MKCTRFNYKPEDVLAAMHAIWRGMSRRQAAKVFNIPRSTLLDKLDGKRPVDASPGPNPFLTKAEERTLESWAIDLHRRGFPLKTEDLKDMAQDVIQNNQRRTSFKNGRPGRSWMRNFLLRHPKMNEFSGDVGPGLRRSRSVTTRDDVRQWCKHHYQFMAALGFEDILDDPNRVFNVDHGEFLFDSTSGLLLEQDRYERAEEKDPEKPEHADRLSPSVECHSVVATFSAAGRMAPLMFVYPVKDLPQEMMEAFPSSWIRTQSESGLLTGKVFLDYIVAFRHWLERENVTLPVLLLVDGRRSRLNMDVTRYCEDQGIILYCLFPTPRPAITELFSSVLHDSEDDVDKLNFASRLNNALNTLYDSESSYYHSFHILPHLQTMLQTLAEVRSQPLDNLPSVNSFVENIGNGSGNTDFEREVDPGPDNNEESDCEFDYELTPVEGEIEMEFPCSGSCDPYSLARHPALLAGSEAPSYLVFEMPPEDINSQGHALNSTNNELPVDLVDQPDVEAHLIVRPLSSPLPDTDGGIEVVESEISEVLETLLSIGSSHQVQFGHVLTACNQSEEPFLGFSPSEAPHKNTQNAHGCLQFIEDYLAGKRLLDEFKAASSEQEWNGVSEARFLFEVWLAASNDCQR